MRIGGSEETLRPESGCGDWLMNEKEKREE